MKIHNFLTLRFLICLVAISSFASGCQSGQGDKPADSSPLPAADKPADSSPLPAADKPLPKAPYITILGIAQDAGYPQAGCQKDCCAPAWENPTIGASPIALGLVNPQGQQKWLFEATPDLPQQLAYLNDFQESPKGHLPDGIFLTHAHIGHYTGLMHLGREAVGAREVPVYTMPRMGEFLQKNGPWSQLVNLRNITIEPLEADNTVQLTENLTVTPFLVPHRDEFSETVGYRIQGPKRTALFIPDIDKWNKWERNLEEEIGKVDLALLDGTFFANGELPGRDMSEIPHPFIAETMELLDSLPVKERNKIIFIHFNHTNPLLQVDSEAARNVIQKGYRIAFEGQILPL